MKNQSALDLFSLGHFLLGMIITFLIFPILFKINSFVKFEMAFVMACICFLCAIGWEYLENGLFKPRQSFKKTIGKIIGEKMYVIDSWINCITDILFVLLGMIPILIIGYNTLPDLQLYFNWSVCLIGIILLIFCSVSDFYET